MISEISDEGTLPPSLPPTLASLRLPVIKFRDLSPAPTESHGESPRARVLHNRVLHVRVYLSLSLSLCLARAYGIHTESYGNTILGQCNSAEGRSPRERANVVDG